MAESHQVLLISFTGPAAGRAAFREALDLPGLRQAAVVERSADGLLDVPESHVSGAGITTAGAGLVGGLVGLLGGPLGVLLGTAAGAALGGAAENQQLLEGGAGLIMLSSRVDEGASLLVVDLRESSPRPGDDLARRHGGTLERISEKEFAAQVRAAEEAAEKNDEDPVPGTVPGTAAPAGAAPDGSPERTPERNADGFADGPADRSPGTGERPA
ncbi:histidine kinase [Streptomyces sp. NPDC058701]|uniref:histidine kinase n=1 Tax=Streptomyces sp. NPDC058701 TaxID=3346608 RepID=UPI0036598E50